MERTTKHQQDLAILNDSAEFARMPERTKQWIKQSPHASEDFAEFFRKDGRIDSSQRIDLPYYQATEPPIIRVDSNTYDALRGPDAGKYLLMEQAMFTTLAHEIGHDRYNTASIKFPAEGSKEQYVDYRSKLEAQAIFNAFPIIDELKDNSTYSARWQDLGYLPGLELAQMFNDWKRGTDPTTTVDRIAKQVADRPYTRSEPLTDRNRDGQLTHRDLYLRDYEYFRRSNPPPINEPANPDEIHTQSNRMSSNDRQAAWPQTRELTREAFERQGRPLSPEALDCIAGCLAVQAKRDGLDRIDHVVLSQHPGGEIGRNVIAVQGGLHDPAQKLSHVEAQRASLTPLDDSLHSLKVIAEAQAQLVTQPDPTPDRPITR
ncbi:XVIPCD domain-containing protein [Pseudomonas sp. CGJS7]|uniref:XVIPCD domain-containing protein n=1 Tax=Pseudomonas sp. CGJS7 TaxID=3109348 RepID=UPI00300B44EF